jgi:hypothetical protein
MPFMEIQYTEDEGWIADPPDYDCPDAPVRLQGEERSSRQYYRYLGRGIFFRWSAPGYLDCTDWYGPYPTMTEARRAVMDEHDSCPDCGATYDYSNDSDTPCEECGGTFTEEV